MRSVHIWRRGLLLAAGLGAGLPAGAAGTITATVSAPNHDYVEVPVSITVPEASVSRSGTVPADATPCQTEPAGPGMVRLTWIVRDLKKGQSRTYRLAPTKTMRGSGVGVELRKIGGVNVNILVNGNFFARYETAIGPNKPYFYPVNAPTGAQIVRRYPLEDSEGETKDHPHHRGISFTHGAMNGYDFWLEGEGKQSFTKHTGYDVLESGPVFGHMRAKTDWVTRDGKKIAEDTRDVRVYAIQGGYLMDFEIALKAVGGPLKWGDTKEGTFAVRVADSMRVNAGKDKVGQGHIVNSEGVTQAATWGKAAKWVDYYGPVEGETVGITILDSPKNPRHPTTWHVRDYGLFAVNPFGLHDFDPKANAEGAGDLTTPEGETTTFRYRLFFHRGTTEEANIAAVWNAYADPPKVEVKPS